MRAADLVFRGESGANAIAKVKAMLREAATRTVPELLDSIGDALTSVTSSDAKAYIAHRGYATR